MPLLYVNVFNKEETSANSDMSISAWNKLAQISLLSSSVPMSATDPTIASIDIRPPFMENVALKEERLASLELDNTFGGNTPNNGLRGMHL